jgi:threonine dehydrogenase-like Zn-dependent dehydrogenase
VAEPGRGEIREEILPAVGPHDVLVRALYSGISRGTESLIFNGRVPASERARMRAPFQAGEFPAPVKYGYCSVGRIEAGHESLVGRDVFCLFPHQTQYVVPDAAVHVLPADVPASRAILAANMETAINGSWDADATDADRVTVIGAGTVGFLVGWVLKTLIGCDVELVDVNERRAATAAVLGLPFATVAAAATDRTIVIHTSGSEAGLQMALRIAAIEGTIVEMSWFGDTMVSLPLGQAFHSRRLTIKSSQVGAIAPSRRAAYDFRRRMAAALELLTAVELDALITGESPFDELPAVMARLAREPGDTLCHRIRYL